MNQRNAKSMALQGGKWTGRGPSGVGSRERPLQSRDRYTSASPTGASPANLAGSEGEGPGGDGTRRASVASAEGHTPPSCNTGAENTKGNEALVDWVAWTDKSGQLLRVLNTLGIHHAETTSDPKGGLGYKSRIRAGAIAIYFDGKPEMGVHVEMSATACRELEMRRGGGNVWRDLFREVIGQGNEFTRLDLAIDDRAGLLDLEQVEQASARGHVRSRFKGGQVIRGFDTSGETKGHTVYFGSSQSRIKCRFYDKAAEQGIDGHWVRAEIQMRDEHATEAAILLMSDSNQVGEVAGGILRNYLNFVDPTGDSNKARWPVSEWWSAFLGDVEKLRLSMGAAPRTIETVKTWLQKQVSTSLALINKFYSDDLSFIVQTILDGETKLKPRHYAILRQSTLTA